MPPERDAAELRFGVATADHQCESYDPAVEDVWDVWERRRGLTARRAATDFWHRYDEDVALAASLGCRAFRFSVAWARVEPTEGTYDDAAFAHYREIVAAIVAGGMAPIVTLHHYTWPLHVERRGGMTAEAFPDIFARYAGEVARRLGSDVAYWITFNEPNQLVYGYVKPWWVRSYFMPPGMHAGATTDEQMASVAGLIRNLFIAHAKGRQAIQSALPHARVGTNPLLLGFPSWLQRLIDLRAERVRDISQFVRSGRRFTERTLLEHGDVDVVLAQFTATPSRADEVGFSAAYYVAGLALMVRRDATFVDASDLTSKRVGVARGTTADFQAADVLPNADAEAFDGYDGALRALGEGSIAAVLADDVVLEALSRRAPGRYRVLTERLRAEPYAAAVSRGNRELLQTIDEAIDRFKKDGGWSASVAMHLGMTPPDPPRQGRSATLADLRGDTERRAPQVSTQPSVRVLRAIRRRGELRVGVRPGVPGFCEAAPGGGELIGLEVDIARRIAGEIFGDETRVRFVPLHTGERIRSLRSFVGVFEPLMRAYGILFTLLTSNWWYLGMQGRLPEFLCPLSCVGALDFVGLDYYWGIDTFRIGKVGQLFDAANQRYSLAPVQPSLLFAILRAHARSFPGKEIVIIENGCVDEADGVTRDRYLRLHVDQVRRAIAAGVPVSAYVCWSITSNREWGAPFGKDSDFGLFHIDLDHDDALRRVPTTASRAYREIIARWTDGGS